MELQWERFRLSGTEIDRQIGILIGIALSNALL